MSQLAFWVKFGPELEVSSTINQTNVVNREEQKSFENVYQTVYSRTNVETVPKKMEQAPKYAINEKF